MKRRLRFRRQYIADLTSAFDYISDSNPRAAQRLSNLCNELARDLTDMPERGPVVYENQSGTLRRVIVPHFENYLMYYRLSSDAVTVVRLLHSSQDVFTQLTQSGDL